MRGRANIRSSSPSLCPPCSRATRASGRTPTSCSSKARAGRLKSTCARAAKCPVALIGDIDRGGIFAQILGTKAALEPEDAAMTVGFIVNKFRGDASLFEGAMATITERTGWRALGLLPFFAGATRLPAEDAFSPCAVQDRAARPGP